MSKSTGRTYLPHLFMIAFHASICDDDLSAPHTSLILSVDLPPNLPKREQSREVQIKKPTPGPSTRQQPHLRTPTPSPHPPPPRISADQFPVPISTPLDNLTDHTFRKHSIIRPNLLTVLLPPLILLLNRLIHTPLRQTPMRTREITLHAASNHRDHGHTQRRHLDSQRVSVGVQGGFAGVVRGAEDIGHYGA